MKKKIYGTIIIILCALSVSATTNDGEEMSKQYLWEYKAIYDKQTADGIMRIKIEPCRNQQIDFKIIFLTGGGFDSGGTSTWSIAYLISGVSTVFILLSDPTNTVYLPNDDNIYTFNCIPLDLPLFEQDDLKIITTNMDATTGSITVTLRAYVNTMEKPTVSIDIANMVLNSVDYNRISGVI